ncbi:MAG: putative oxidoreductase [Chlamydiae bacterium]|nr:putative oxidoreductase [Chlamydiota bacterium]
MINNKLKLPQVGLGCYLLEGKQTSKMVRAAYDMGYRHFDTAAFYANEEEVGEALKNTPRASFQITTKLWHDEMGYHKALNGFERSLNKLQMDYVDLYLIHWPDPRDLILETLEAFEVLKKAGKIKHYGVCNFTQHHLEDAMNAGFQVAVNQVEYHPYLNQENLLNFCLKSKIQLIAYSPFIRGELQLDPLLCKIGQKYNKTWAQVAIRWLLQKEIVTIPKTSSIDRLRENFDVFDFNLTDEDMLHINQLNRNYRQTDPDCGDFNY